MKKPKGRQQKNRADDLHKNPIQRALFKQKVRQELNLLTLRLTTATDGLVDWDMLASLAWAVRLAASVAVEIRPDTDDAPFLDECLEKIRSMVLEGGAWREAHYQDLSLALEMAEVVCLEFTEATVGKLGEPTRLADCVRLGRWPD